MATASFGCTQGKISARHGVSLISPVPKFSAARATASSIFASRRPKAAPTPKQHLSLKRSNPTGQGSSIAPLFRGGPGRSPASAAIAAAQKYCLVGMSSDPDRERLFASGPIEADVGGNAPERKRASVVDQKAEL